MPYLIGAVGGLLGGLFGSGSGLVILPAIINFLKIDEYAARGTTLITVLFIVISSSFFYYKNHYFNFEMGLYTAIGGVVGGMLGAKWVKSISKDKISLIFEIFVIVVALMMIFS